MISSNKSPESDNALLRRIQRYAQASTIFRSTESAPAIQRSGHTPAKAILLSGPSSLPMGKTAVAQGLGQTLSQAPNSTLPMPEPANYSVSAAIDQVTQMQRSPAAQVFTSQPAAPTQTRPAPAPIIPTVPTIQAAPAPEKATSDSDWSRLQRIIKGHETKQAPVADSQPIPTAAPPVQRAEAPLAVAPPAVAPPAESIQRAIEAAEVSQTSAQPQKAPLESMWPVQRTEPEAARASDEPVVMRQPETPISTEPVQSAAEAELIRRKLGDVSATQRSDSSVELHLPRRPRPAVVQAKPATEDPNTAFWNRMRKMEGKPPETVQRTVETEIGPLPADMWELLGETPPGYSTETAVTSSETTPTIQPKREEPEFASPPTATSETEIPSFLAKAASIAQPASDAVQRAIAAAESPEIQAQITSTPETTLTPIQRQETVTSTPSAPSKPESRAATHAVDPIASPVSAQQVTTTPLAPSVEPPVQRTITPPGASEAAIEPGQIVQTSEPATDYGEITQTSNQENSEASPPVASAPTADGNDQATHIQRAIYAAEAPAPPQGASPSAADTASEPAQPSVTLAPAEGERIQPKQSNSARAMPMAPTIANAAAAPSQTMPATATGSVVTGSLPTDNLEDSIQREAASPESSSVMAQTVDLNAKTGPLPALPDGERGSVTPALSRVEVAVSSSSPAPDSHNDIQRAIAAAESIPVNLPQQTAAPSTPSTTLPTSPTAVPNIAPPIIQMKPVTSPEMTIPTAKSPIETETAVTPPAAEPPTPDTLQRAIAAAEAPPASDPFAIHNPVLSNVEGSQFTIHNSPETAVTPPTAETPTPDTLQRDIAAAETPPASDPFAIHNPVLSNVEGSEFTIHNSPETAVTPPTAETPTPDTLQRAIAAAEAPPASDPFAIHNPVLSNVEGSEFPIHNSPETATSAPLSADVTTPTAKTPTPDTIQRAIAAAEAPPASDPFTIHNPVLSNVEGSQFTIHNSPETATSAPLSADVVTPAAKTPTPDTIQRAIAAVEAPPASDLFTIHNPVLSNVEGSEFPIHNSPETATSAPLSADVATPTTKTPTPDTLQRAIAAAEAPPASDPFTIHNPVLSNVEGSQFTIHNSPETATSAPLSADVVTPTAETPTPDTLQRAIAAAEAPPASDPFTIHNPVLSNVEGSQFTIHNSPETAVQRPFATAEMPSSLKTTTPTLMRAIATAESTPEPTKAAYQWPDISPIKNSPAAATQTQNNIQRYEMNPADVAIQENIESTNESSNHVDVDKLANEVYSQLRKRLAIEWERGRGKR